MINKKTTNIILFASIISMLISIVSGFIQKMYYDSRIDEQGFMHDSWFLPISILALMLSVLLFLIWLVAVIVKRFVYNKN